MRTKTLHPDLNGALGRIKKLKGLLELEKRPFLHPSSQRLFDPH